MHLPEGTNTWQIHADIALHMKCRNNNSQRHKFTYTVYEADGEDDENGKEQENMKEKRRTKEEKPYGGVKMGSTKAVQLPLTSEGARGDTLQ